MSLHGNAVTNELVIPTRRGKEVVAIVQRLVPTIEERIEELVGPKRATALRRSGGHHR